MSSVIKNSALKSVVARTYSTPANVTALQRASEKPNIDYVKGIPICSLETNSPVSSLAFIYKSGSRYENLTNLGLSHGIKAFSASATQSFSSFGVTRNIEQLGSNFFCEVGREHIIYGMNILRDYANSGYKIVSECATDHAYKHWEIERAATAIKYGLDQVDTQTKLIELVHSTAYKRGGLSNSLFAPNYRNGLYFTNELAKFMVDTHTKDRLAIVGVGVSEDDLNHWTSTLIDPNDDSTDTTGLEPSKYLGGEYWVDQGGKYSHVAVVGEGAKIGSIEAASLLVAANVLKCDNGLNGVFGSTDSASPLFTSNIAAGGSGNCSVINLNYTDSGLFGFSVCDKAENIAEVTKSLIKVMRTFKITEGDLKKAVLKAKSAIRMAHECPNYTAKTLAMELLYSNKCSTVEEQLAALDDVTVQSVQSAISSSLKSKPTMVAMGNLSRVPRLAEL